MTNSRDFGVTKHGELSNRLKKMQLWRYTKISIATAQKRLTESERSQKLQNKIDSVEANSEPKKVLPLKELMN